MTAPVKGVPIVSGDWSLEQLKRSSGGGVEGEKARLRKATKEFEAFFVYQMLKTMRETIPDNPLSQGSPLSDGLGKETFTQIFDMEVARKVTIGGNTSIADLLYKSMEKLVDAQYQQASAASGTEEKTQELKPLTRTHSKSIALPKQEARPIQKEKTAVPLPKKATDALPIQTAPRKVTKDPIMEKFGTYIHQAARETKLDSALIASVIQAESSGNPGAVSPAGAKGLMQLADSTAQDLKVTDAFDPEENIKAGSRYLRSMLDRFGSVDLALAAYNAGPGTVEKYGGIPPFSETQEYVKRVTDLADGTGTRAVTPGASGAQSATDKSLADDELSGRGLKVGTR